MMKVVYTQREKGEMKKKRDIVLYSLKMPSFIEYCSCLFRNELQIEADSIIKECHDRANACEGEYTELNKRALMNFADQLSRIVEAIEKNDDSNLNPQERNWCFKMTDAFLVEHENGVDFDDAISKNDINAD